MKKIIPFKKNLTFNTNVSEITSISLENTLNYKNYNVLGDLIISGTYKITDTSIKVDNFEFKIPIEIEIDKKYIIDDIIIDIDDFYYEIINNNILEVNIDVLIDNIIEKPMIEQVKEIKTLVEDFEVELERKEDNMHEQENNNQNLIKTEERCIEEEVLNNQNHQIKEPTNRETIKTDINEILNDINNDNEIYSTYCVYIVREGDTIESILSKYSITHEILGEYNDLSEIKLGDKLIIPDNNVRI